jgi:hypothetical protein
MTSGGANSGGVIHRLKRLLNLLSGRIWSERILLERVTKLTLGVWGLPPPLWQGCPGKIHYDAVHARQNQRKPILSGCRDSEGAEHAIRR